MSTVSSQAPLSAAPPSVCADKEHECVVGDTNKNECNPNEKSKSSPKNDGKLPSDTGPFLFTSEEMGVVQVQKLDRNSNADPLPVEDMKVNINSLYHPNGTILFLVRRPGCWLCRADAKELSSIQSELKSEGIEIGMVGVLKENKDKEIRGFLPSFPNEYNNIYLDTAKASNRVMKHPKPKIGALDLFSLSGWKRIWHSGTGGNMKGEGIIKGGTIILGSKKDNYKVLFAHYDSIDSKPDMAKVKEILKNTADPNYSHDNMNGNSPNPSKL